MKATDAPVLACWSHALLPHTADAGITAAAPDLPALFEEAAQGLAELASDVSGDLTSGRPPVCEERIELAAHDLVGLAFLWLNELIGRGELRRAAVVGATVERIDPPGPAGEARLAARVRLAPFDGVRVRPRAIPRSATLHRLTVTPTGDGWRLVAYLDL